MDNRRTVFRFSVGARDFSLLRNFQPGFWAHPRPVQWLLWTVPSGREDDSRLVSRLRMSGVMHRPLIFLSGVNIDGLVYTLHLPVR